MPQRTGSHILLLWLGPLWPWELGAVPCTPTGSSLGGAWVPGVRGGADDGRCGCQVVLGLPGSLWSHGVTRQQAMQDQLAQALHVVQGGVSESVHEQRARERQDDGVPGPATPARCTQGCGGGRPGTRLLVLGAAPTLGGSWQRWALPLGPLLGLSASRQPLGFWLTVEHF